MITVDINAHRGNALVALAGGKGRKRRKANDLVAILNHKTAVLSMNSVPLLIGGALIMEGGVV